MPLAEFRLVKRRFGGTVNDVVLATVTGALRRYLSQRGMRFERGEIRAAVPVSMRDPGSSSGNQVSVWLLPLPLTEADPERRLSRSQQATARLAAGGEHESEHRFLGRATPAPQSRDALFRDAAQFSVRVRSVGEHRKAALRKNQQ